MSDAAKGLEPLNRPVTDDERVLIKWLLGHGKPGSEDFLQQVDSLVVVRKCMCGCPTVYFSEKSEPIVREAEHILADYLATANGEDVGIILFQKAGSLSCLEVYSQTGSDKPFGLPAIETIYPYEEAAARQANRIP